MDQPTPVPSLAEIEVASGIKFPNGVPYTHITFALVAWNEGRRPETPEAVVPRLAALLAHVRPYFERLVVGVQASDDNTLEIAQHYADKVVEDLHHGYGDATFGPKLLPEVRTPWTLKLDADEWPSNDLLESLSNATWWADNSAKTRGVWIPFHSSVDGVEYEEQHAHLRLFHTSAGWPGTMHSRPPINDGVLWGTGHIRHDRSLDEMIQDYLRYLARSGNNPGWNAHNRLMIKGACTGTAEVKGWDYVKAFPWWPQVQEIVEE